MKSPSPPSPPHKGFRAIVGYLREHLKETWHPGYFGAVFLFVGVLIWLNYGLLPGQTLERWLLRTFRESEWGILAYLVFYAVPYWGVLLLYGLIRRDWSWARQRQFWIRSLFGLSILSLDGAFYYYQLVGELATAYELKYWLYKVSATLISAICLGLPLWLFRRFWDKQQPDFYGLRFRGFDYRPYLIMLLLMVPIVLAASFMEDFISYYPTLKLKYVQKLTSPPFWASVGIYEVLYLLDFIWTELIFRGFFVIGVVGVLGKRAVMPMAALYVSRHFAKPLGETISSFFGGYILGVIAYKSRNIMGGVMIHMGVAFLMEVFALLQYWWRFG